MSRRIIEGSASLEEAADIGAATLVTVLLLEEALKAQTVMGFLNDKRNEIDEAWEAIDQFLGKDEDGDTRANSFTGEHSSKPNNGSRADDLCAIEEGKASGRPISWEVVQMDVTQSLCLNSVFLSYPGRELPVLNNYSQKFERGKIHALLGESGKWEKPLHLKSLLIW